MAFFLFFAVLFLQPVSGSAEENIAELFDQEQLAGDLEQLQQDLENLKVRKIPVNSADAEELRQLPWLNSGDILAIIEQRNLKGRLDSLRDIEGVIGREKAAAIAPYIAFDDPVALRKAVRKDEAATGSYYSRLSFDTTPRDGLSNGRYPGDNFKIYNRLQADYANFHVSLVHDKDIGEPDVADFVSLSLSASDIGIVRQAVLGNYRLNFGQGLLVGQSRFMSKGSAPSNSVRIGSKRLSPFASSSEYGFFQGAAAKLDLQPLEVTAFWSANLVDARNTTGTITSFDESGYHRTTTERDHKDNVTETVYGAGLLYHFSSGAVTGRAGGTWLRYDYGEPLKALGSLEGASSLGSLECDLLIGRLGFFGEAAWSEKPHGRVSWIAGLDYQVLPKVNIQFAVRDYDPGYYSPFAGAFAERGDNASNEKGCYIGIEGAISSKVSMGAYVDWFRFPKLNPDPKVYAYPSSGYDTRIFLTWKQSPMVTWNLQVQHKEKEDVLKQCANGSVSCKSKEKVYAPLPMVTDRFRLDCDIDLSRKLHLRSRGEVKRVVEDFLAGDETYYGWLFYQQANFRAGRFGLKGRFTVFHTDDYDAAIYTYEDDLPFVFNSTAFSGRGKALFLVASWDVTRNLKLAGKFETTWFDDRDVFGSNKDDRRDTSAPGSVHLGCFLKF
ncbi:MAG: helix-hairpin-helix domain-containing protein [Chlorobi bacterium]|nr:helix-hairpin-helix domain-containing protein [Chlorobiota bacterium]